MKNFFYFFQATFYINEIGLKLCTLLIVVQINMIIKNDYAMPFTSQIILGLQNYNK